MESVEGCVAAAAAATAAVTKSTTPCILKHGRKRMRASVSGRLRKKNLLHFVRYIIILKTII